MELNELKTAWNKVNGPIKTSEEIQQMLKENNHPVLKEIRKQLLIEIILWSAFLMVFYNWFDGDKKPLFINIVLIIGVITALAHNLMGYNLSKYLDAGNTLQASMQYYIVKVRTYMITSVILRIPLMSGFLLFFTFNISFNYEKYILLALLVAFFSLQLYFLCRIWSRRLKKLKSTLSEFL